MDNLGQDMDHIKSRYTFRLPPSACRLLIKWKFEREERPFHDRMTVRREHLQRSDMRRFGLVICISKCFHLRKDHKKDFIDMPDCSQSTESGSSQYAI